MIVVYLKLNYWLEDFLNSRNLFSTLFDYETDISYTLIRYNFGLQLNDKILLRVLLCVHLILTIVKQNIA